MADTLKNKPKFYEPFPPGEVPKGWPKEYVSASAYRRLLSLYRKARAELREIDGGGGPLFDGDMP